MSCAKVLFCVPSSKKEATAQDASFDGNNKSKAERSLGEADDDDNDKSKSEQQPEREESVYFDAMQSLRASDMTTTKECEECEEVMEPLKDHNNTEHHHHRMTLQEPNRLLSNRNLTKRQNSETFRRKKRNAFSSSLRKMLTLGVAQKSSSIPMEDRGYPGFLTEKELQIAQSFHEELQKRDPVYKEIVYNWNEIEEEPYALCRFLRARDFNVEEVFKMLDEAIEAWNEAKSHDFYPDPDKALDNPTSVLLTQYPIAKLGMAKNKCPVSYLKAGHIQPEGVECVTTLPNMTKYFWYDNMHQYTQFMAQMQAKDPDIVRMEIVSVMDLEGLTASQLNSKTMDVMKAASAVAICFPESLNAMLVLNAPGYFAFTWKVIKGFLPPRTAAKVEVYSSKSKGQKRLHELIGQDQLPSDYGGNLISTTEKMQQTGTTSSSSSSSSLPPLQRQIVQLMSIKSSSKPKHYNFDLKHDEMASFTVYTKSFSGGDFTIQQQNSDEVVANNVLVKGKGTEDDPLPRGTEIATDVKGPGSFSIAAKAISSKSNDHFLVIGDVFCAS